MPSRKRNKGKERKERKAQKEAAEEAAKVGAWWRGWAMPENKARGCCLHGCVLPPPDHAVYRFMNTIDELHNGENHMLINL